MTLELEWWELIVNTWLVMAVLTVGSWLITRRMRYGEHPSGWQNWLETLVEAIQGQIDAIVRGDTRPYLAFVGTLFLFIFTANLLSVVPSADRLVPGLPAIYHPPTASLNTTGALALSVFLAVPFYGIARHGFRRHLGSYLQPTPFMLPFNVVGELSRMLALAMRLFGNMMSGVVVVAIVISIAPLFFPVVLQLFGLITGAIQAYIFAILAIVYIASATQTQRNVGDE